jgi:hypothetical protein
MVCSSISSLPSPSNTRARGAPSSRAVARTAPAGRPAVLRRPRRPPAGHAPPEAGSRRHRHRRGHREAVASVQRFREGVAQEATRLREYDAQAHLTASPERSSGFKPCPQRPRGRFCAAAHVELRRTFCRWVRTVFGAIPSCALCPPHRDRSAAADHLCSRAVSRSRFRRRDRHGRRRRAVTPGDRCDQLDDVRVEAQAGGEVRATPSSGNPPMAIIRRPLRQPLWPVPRRTRRPPRGGRREDLGRPPRPDRPPRR